MKRVFVYLSAFSLAACGNPGGISDAEYAKYKELAAPKILYACHQGTTPAIDIEASSVCLKIENDLPRQLKCLENAKRKPEPIVDVGYVAGVGVGVTYNKLLSDAKSRCDGEFKILDSKS